MKIVRVLKVEDTRQWEEVEDDVWKPIPGTGIDNQCARCGRSHEVHATVEVVGDDGKLGSVIVGTGCMHADETEIVKKITSILNAQRTLERNKRLLAKKEALHAECERIATEVDALPVPQITETVGQRIKVGSYKGRMSRVYICGDTEHVGGLVDSDYFSDNQVERDRAQAIYMWKDARCVERGMTSDMINAHHWLKGLKKRIESQEKKIAEFGLQQEA